MVLGRDSEKDVSVFCGRDLATAAVTEYCCSVSVCTFLVSMFNTRREAGGVTV